MAPVNRLRAFQVLAVSTAAATYVTIVLGGYVSATNAGLACPDWPMCQGVLVPDLSDPWILTEYAHRLWALMTSALIVVTAGVALAWYRQERRAVSLSLATASLLAGQITLGMLTIASRLDPAVVTSHLALGAATLGAATALAVLAIWGRPAPSDDHPTSGRTSLDNPMQE